MHDWDLLTGFTTV